MKNFLFALATFVAVNSLALSQAHAMENDFSSWSAFILQGKATDKWGYYLEAQTRLNQAQDAGAAPDPLKLKGNRFMVRPAIRFMPFGDNSLQLSLGYAWTPNFSPFRDEQRIWEQVSYQANVGDWLLATRLRFEQRFIEDAQGTSWRVRYFARANKHFTADRKYALAVWDEIFFNFNSVNLGPQSGFDQNRVFIGPNIAVNKNTHLEVGYVNVYVPKGTATDSIDNHVFAAYAYLDW